MNQTTRFSGPVTKLKTGITGFDEISFGGLPERRSTLVAGTAGSAKTLFAIQFLVRGIEDFNESGVFVTFEETPEDIIRNVRSLGWNLDKYVEDGKLVFVDVSQVPEVIHMETGGYDLSGLLVRIENGVKKVDATRMVIDSVGSLFSQFENSGLVRRELDRMAACLKKLGVTSVVTVERVSEYGEVARFGVEEFVADNVIILRNSLEEERRRRTIEILKYRGAIHQKGECPFAVSPHGIEILPLSSMELIQESSNARISSGNTDLDNMCGGGLYCDSITLISGPTGCGKTLLVTTFLNDGCNQGEKVLLFSFEESRNQLVRNAKGCGMDFEKWEDAGLLKIVCVYPDSMPLEDQLIKIKDEIESFKPTRTAIDSLSALERVSSNKSFREFTIGLTSYLKTREIAGMLTSATSSLVGGASITEMHISTVTDTIILLRYVEILGTMHRGLTVLKMRGSAHDKSIREYTIDDSGIHFDRAFREVEGILAGVPTLYSINKNVISDFSSDLQP